MPLLPLVAFVFESRQPREIVHRAHFVQLCFERLKLNVLELLELCLLRFVALHESILKLRRLVDHGQMPMCWH